MKKNLSYALLTISIIGFNVLPAKAISNTVENNQLQSEVNARPGEWCMWFPHVGLVCYDFS